MQAIFFWKSHQLLESIFNCNLIKSLSPSVNITKFNKTSFIWDDKLMNIFKKLIYLFILSQKKV